MNKEKPMDEFEVWFKGQFTDLDSPVVVVQRVMAKAAWQASERATMERVVKKLRGLEKEGKQPTLQWIIDYVEREV